MKFRLFSAALVLAAGLLPAMAQAEVRSGFHTLSPMLGGVVMEGDQNADNGIAFSLGVGYNFTDSFGVEAVLAGANLEEANNDDDTSLLTLRVDGLYHLRPEGPLVPYAAVGLGLYSLDGDEEFMADYGLGLLYFLADNLALRADVRHLLAFNESNLENNLLYTAGLKFQFGGPKAPAPAPAPAAPKDSDGDGVTDDLDRCPGTPQGVKVDASGCPLDSDGDGVPDHLDKCPDTPKGIKVDAGGCPPDSDGDGVPDHLDKCPDTPKGVNVDASGCPLDSDGDGVADHLDKCPDTPKGVKVDANGCPPDSDGDGVADHLDQCPGTPKGIIVDEKGCELKLTLHINFDFDKADIKPEFKAELDKAAAFIRQNSQVPYILVAGHTDSVGSDEYNQKLSERRAAAVQQALIRDYGMEPGKFRSKGFGESQPVADNTTEEGRYQNRRVEVICCAILPE